MMLEAHPRNANEDTALHSCFPHKGSLVDRISDTAPRVPITRVASCREAVEMADR